MTIEDSYLEKKLITPHIKDKYIRGRELLLPHLDTINIESFLSSVIDTFSSPTPSIENVVYLTDHGLKHTLRVKEIIERIVEYSKIPLSEQEIFLLLLSAYAHDLGLTWGKPDHEKKAYKIINDTIASTNTSILQNFEKITLHSIIKSHAGEDRGNKDKLSKLEPVCDTLNGNIRLRLLSSLLRFSDELADDCDRAALFTYEKELINKLPQTKIFFDFCKCIQPVAIKNHDDILFIKLNINVAKDIAVQKYLHGGTEIFMNEYIHKRLLKMEKERRYCMRYMYPINISRIDVKINYLCEEGINIIYNYDLRLEEKGYPDDLSITHINLFNPSDPSRSIYNGSQICDLYSAR